MIQNTAEIRHNILDQLEVALVTNGANVPTFGFVEINTWFSNLNSGEFHTPNGIVKVTEHGVKFTHSTDPTKSRILFEIGLDGTNIFQRRRAYETWMFFRFAPLNLIRFKELTAFANSMIRES